MKTTSTVALSVLLSLSATSAACGGEVVPGPADGAVVGPDSAVLPNPSCAALCREPPDLRLCSDSSLASCSRICSLRLQDTSSVCGQCLLDGARFEPPGGFPVPVCAPQDGVCEGAEYCTIAGCPYCSDQESTGLAICGVRIGDLECSTFFVDPCAAVCD